MKKNVYMLMVDAWRLMCRYQFRRLSDHEWENFTAEGEKLLAEYRMYGPALEKLCREIFYSLTAFYELLGRQEEESNM